MKRIFCLLLFGFSSLTLTIGQQKNQPADVLAKSIGEYRKRIDEIDKQVILLLNERADIALELGRIRQREKIPPASAKGREAEVLRNAMA